MKNRTLHIRDCDVTAFALYYAGSDAVRVVAADIHIAAGLGLPVLIVTHIVLGRRTHAFARQARVGPLTPRPLLRPVTFSEDRESHVSAVTFEESGRK